MTSDIFKLLSACVINAGVKLVGLGVKCASTSLMAWYRECQARRNCWSTVSDDLLERLVDQIEQQFRGSSKAA